MGASFKPLNPTFKANGTLRSGTQVDPLRSVVIAKLAELREGRLNFLLVGCPRRCNQGCWQLKAQQQADSKALHLLGELVPAGQYPMAALVTDGEIPRSFRGYALRCPCLATDPDQSQPIASAPTDSDSPAHQA